MKQTNVTPFFKDGVHVVGQRTAVVTIPDNESQVFNNQIYSDLTLEVKGTDGGVAFPVKLMGCIDTESAPNYVPLAGMELSADSNVTQIEKSGLYRFSVVGISHVKIVLAASGSDLTITGKFVE